MFTIAIPTCSNFLEIFGNTFLFTKYFSFLFDFSIIFYQLSSTKIGTRWSFRSNWCKV